MQQFFLAGELKEIFNSFAIVKGSTGTATDLTTSTEDSTSGGEGSETATAIGTTTQEEEDGGDTECDPSYPDDCIPPSPPDLNCDDDGVPENFQVVGSDPHGFDGDNDGIGCESESDTPDDGSDDDDDNGGDDDNGDNNGEDGNEGEGNQGEGNPNEFDDCIVPPGMDPGDIGC